jgi:hypothetical protein
VSPQILYAEVNYQLMRSTDGGTTWSNLPVQLLSTGQLLVSPDGSRVYVFDRAGFRISTDGQTAFRDYSGGLFQSSDGGETWTQNPLPGALACSSAQTLHLDQNAAMTLYVDQSAESNLFLASVSADTKTLNFASYLGSGSGYCGRLPGDALQVAVDGAGNAILASGALSFAPTVGSVNQGSISIAKISRQ